MSFKDGCKHRAGVNLRAPHSCGLSGICRLMLPGEQAALRTCPLLCVAPLVECICPLLGVCFPIDSTRDDVLDKAQQFHNTAHVLWVHMMCLHWEAHKFDTSMQHLKYNIPRGDQLAPQGNKN